MDRRKRLAAPQTSFKRRANSFRPGRNIPRKNSAKEEYKGASFYAELMKDLPNLAGIQDAFDYSSRETVGNWTADSDKKSSESTTIVVDDVFQTPVAKKRSDVHDHISSSIETENPDDSTLPAIEKERRSETEEFLDFETVSNIVCSDIEDSDSSTSEEEISKPNCSKTHHYFEQSENNNLNVNICVSIERGRSDDRNCCETPVVKNSGKRKPRVSLFPQDISESSQNYPYENNGDNEQSENGNNPGSRNNEEALKRQELVEKQTAVNENGQDWILPDSGDSSSDSSIPIFVRKSAGSKNGDNPGSRNNEEDLRRQELVEKQTTVNENGQDWISADSSDSSSDSFIPIFVRKSTGSKNGNISGKSHKKGKAFRVTTKRIRKTIIRCNPEEREKYQREIDEYKEHLKNLPTCPLSLKNLPLLKYDFFK